MTALSSRKPSLPALALLWLFALMTAACQSVPATTSAATGPVLVRDTGEYRLGPADRIRVTVYNEASMSGEFQVDGEGMVSLPLIGEVKASGLTLREFQTKTEARLSDGYLRDPSVSAEVLNFRPYYILGEVAKPGEYPFTNRLTVLNAIATAEGFTYRANKKIVALKPADATEESRVELTPTTRVMPGDTIRILERMF